MSALTIVIPDTGPLITLAKADALDFLLSFNDEVRLVLTDVVEFEATRHRSDHEDAGKICDFILANVARITIEKTTYGEMAISAAKARQQYDESPVIQALFKSNNLPPPAKIAVDSGEMSIISYISGMIAAPPGVPCLVIAEDDFFLRSTSGALPGNAHIISTMAFLKALEALNPKCHAQAVLDAAVSVGRKPNDANVDKVAEKVAGGTVWKDLLNGERLESAISDRRRRISKRSGTTP